VDGMTTTTTCLTYKHCIKAFRRGKQAKDPQFVGFVKWNLESFCGVQLYDISLKKHLN